MLGDYLIRQNEKKEINIFHELLEIRPFSQSKQFSIKN